MPLGHAESCIVSPFQGFSIFDCFFSIDMSSLWDFGFCGSTSCHPSRVFPYSIVFFLLTCHPYGILDFVGVRYLARPPPPRPHPGPLHFLETERETLIIFSTIFIYSAFSWLESGEGGQRPDEVKHDAVGLVSSKISKDKVNFPTKSKTKILIESQTNYHLPLTIHHSPFTIHHSPLTIHHLPKPRILW